MTITGFTDDIVTITELKNNQKAWFDKAYKNPVSITSPKGRNFVLMNRELLRYFYLLQTYADYIVQLCDALGKTGKDIPEDVFPWAKKLSVKDREQFIQEAISTFRECLAANSWEALEELIESWKATAEALSNAEFMKAVKAKKADRKYTAVE